MMLRDNTAGGSGRLLREVGGAVVDPVGAFTRLVHGDLAREFPNPTDRFPSRFTLVADTGYRSIGGAVPHQGLVTFDGFYGDPFSSDISHPFDSFWSAIDINSVPVDVARSKREQRPRDVVATILLDAILTAPPKESWRLGH
jgi:hypothetical protein